MLVTRISTCPNSPQRACTENEVFFYFFIFSVQNRELKDRGLSRGFIDVTLTYPGIQGNPLFYLYGKKIEKKKPKYNKKIDFTPTPF